ncbi:hypothetical protein QSQ_2117 [Clostridioides difficile P32]|nr:hypothetical protein HMPREF1122_03508 [Clostridioides difficile 002-P50-2011]EHJ26721.1 hypothetical protein HMPREF1123_02857 [Clostridioides difficile 050-P50-2011]EHJ40973.1 hypothetical protein HMPREF9945_00197 [Clostridioides difficile 70-100-2010]EQE30054.1 hypothetical protein QC5_2150 [Clostridioides difficile CD34]EQE43652.1 hypothetical protein QCC_1822 [Clostridioides difficile CD41]EQE48813.1 hypothetical protein QCE_2157 [Clostridioides difficile CD42]EQE63109.1 hypothetical pr
MGKINIGSIIFTEEVVLMDRLKRDMKNMKEDLKEGVKKTAYVMKNTAEDLKDDAQGAMVNLEMKKDEMMERYEQKKFSKELEKQMKNEMK